MERSGDVSDRPREAKKNDVETEQEEYAD